MSKVVEFVIISGWALLIVVCFSTILLACYVGVANPDVPVPDILEKLAFTSAGFLFGSFPVMVKDLLISERKPG